MLHTLHWFIPEWNSHLMDVPLNETEKKNLITRSPGSFR